MEKCLKKDFSHIPLFDNKYCEQSYIGYLSKGKIKYIMNTSDFMDRNIVFTIDFIFRINNAICRRGSIENNKRDIEQLYNCEWDIQKYKYYGKETIEHIYKQFNNYTSPNEYEVEICSMLKKVIDLKEILFDDYDNFKIGIYELVKTINDKHYTWVVGENIIYNRSICDNMTKKYYCAILGQKGYDKFKTIYYDNIYLETRLKKKTFEQVCDLLIIIADTYNNLIMKDYDNATDELNSYLEDNISMLECKDIYYTKIFVDLKKVLSLLKVKKRTDAINIIKEIMQNENKKYKNNLLLYENIPIDEKAIEQGQYIEL